jgi:hypothetical protein
MIANANGMWRGTSSTGQGSNGIFQTRRYVRGKEMTAESTETRGKFGLWS